MTGHADAAGNTYAPKKQKKPGYRDFGADTAGFDQKIDDRQRTDGIGHIVSALRQSHITGSADLDALENRFGTAVFVFHKMFQKTSSDQS